MYQKYVFFIVVIDGGLDDSEFEFKFDEVGDKQKYQLKYREFFLFRQVEIFFVIYIRGKCIVILLNEIEFLFFYLNKDVRIFFF